MKKNILKIICFFALISVVFFGTEAFAWERGMELTDIDVYIEGEKLELNVYQQSFYVLVPLREMSEYLGAEVIWNGDDQSVDIISDKGEYSVAIDSAEINEIAEDKFFARLRFPVVLYKGKTYIERFFFEDCFYTHVDLNYEKKAIEITKDYSLKKVIDNNKLTVGLDVNRECFEKDIANEIARRLGVNVEFKSASGSKYSVDDVDMFFVGESQNLDNDKYIYQSYIDDGYAVLAKNDCGIVTRKQLNEAKIGILQKENVSEFKDSELIRFKNEDLMLKALKMGKIDVCFMKKLDAQNSIVKDSKDYKLLEFLFDREEKQIAYRSDKRYLKEQIFWVLDEMRVDGTYGELVTKWFGSKRIAYIDIDENKDMIYNGEKYILSDDFYSGGNIGKNLGTMAKWGDDLKIYNNLDIYAGVFEIEGSNGTKIASNPPNDEWHMLYIKETENRDKE